MFDTLALYTHNIHLFIYLYLYLSLSTVADIKDIPDLDVLPILDILSQNEEITLSDIQTYVSNCYNRLKETDDKYKSQQQAKERIAQFDADIHRLLLEFLPFLSSSYLDPSFLISIYLSLSHSHSIYYRF